MIVIFNHALYYTPLKSQTVKTINSYFVPRN